MKKSIKGQENNSASLYFRPDEFIDSSLTVTQEKTHEEKEKETVAVLNLVGGVQDLRPEVYLP